MKKVMINSRSDIVNKDYYFTNLNKALLSEGIKLNFFQKFYFFFPSFRNALFTKCKILHFHWLHEHTGFNRKNLLKFWVKLILFLIDFYLIRYLLKMKTIWTIHNLYSHESYHPFSERIIKMYFARKVDMIITHCNTAMRIVKQEYNISKSKMAVIPHGHYLNNYENLIAKKEARKKLNLRDTDLIFLCFGRIRPYKEVDELVSAFNQFRGVDDIKLLIVGRPLNNRIKYNLLKLSKENKNIICILKFILDKHIQIYMNASDVVVIPYREILTSGAAILAMSFEKPIIAPYLGCIIDILDGNGAFLYDSKKLNGLFHALNRAIKEKSKLFEMGKNNLKLVKKYNWKEIGKKTSEIYSRFLK
jgi:glycosyltransferase involved in cell wall biosynthesis